MPYFHHFLQTGDYKFQQSKQQTPELRTNIRKNQEFASTFQKKDMYGTKVKCGYLLHYKKRVVGRNWTEKIVVLYSDSRLAWFREGSTVAEESILLSDAPELLAAGQWVWRIPRPPSLPTGACPKLAIACGTSVRERAQWFLCRSQDDLIDWMKAINSVLPLPPPPPELYPSTIKPLDPQLLATLETLCQESFTKQQKGGSKHDLLLGSCCTDDTPRTLPSELNNYNSICRESSNKMSSYDKELLATQSNRPEMQILRTRRPSSAKLNQDKHKNQDFARYEVLIDDHSC